MKVRVLVRLKPGVLDPQGRAVHHALEGLGFAGVEDVRVGRLIELDVADGTDPAALTEIVRKIAGQYSDRKFRHRNWGTRRNGHPRRMVSGPP